MAATSTTVWVVTAALPPGEGGARLLGAYAGEDEARRAAAEWAAARVDLAHYDPAGRFRCVAPGRWADAWLRRSGAPEVRVEAVRLGAAPCLDAPAATRLVLSLDAALKDLALRRGGQSPPSELDVALEARRAFEAAPRAREWREEPRALAR